MTALGIGLIVIGIVGGGAMWKFGGAMEKQGASKVKEAYHKSEMEKDTLRSEAVMGYQIEKTVNKIEQEELEEDGASEKDITKKALERWGD